MDRGAWQAIVYGVAKSQTQFSGYTTKKVIFKVCYLTLQRGLVTLPWSLSQQMAELEFSLWNLCCFFLCQAKILNLFIIKSFPLLQKLREGAITTFLEVNKVTSSISKVLIPRYFSLETVLK